MIELLFAMIALASWSNSDVHTGKVHNLALALPIVIMGIFFPLETVFMFVPIFVCLSAFWFILRTRGLFGFADVIGIPFTLVFVLRLHFLGILVFMGVFAPLMIIAGRGRMDKKLKRKVHDRVILMPVLFLAFFVGVVTHLISILLF